MTAVELMQDIRATAFHLATLHQGLCRIEAYAGAMDPDLICDAHDRLMDDLATVVGRLVPLFDEAESIGLLEALTHHARSLSAEVVSC